MNTLERYYHISSTGKLSMKPETVRECPEFRANLKRLVDAKMNEPLSGNKQTVKSGG